MAIERRKPINMYVGALCITLVGSAACFYILHVANTMDVETLGYVSIPELADLTL